MLDITRAYGLNFLFPETDRVIGGGLRLFGEFGLAEIMVMREYMGKQEPGTFLDIGANIGAMCLPLALNHPAWRFVAVEAHRGIAQVLSANTFSNHIYNVDVVQAAIGEAEGVVGFPALSLQAVGNFGVLGLHRGTDGPTNPTLLTTIDALAPADTRFIKMDIEGNEAAALLGAHRTLTETRPIWLVEASSKYEVSAREMIAGLLSADYDLFWFYSPFTNMKSQRKRAGATPRKTGDTSVLALPKGVENLWNLPRVRDAAEDWPTNASIYPYLAEYGYKV